MKKQIGIFLGLALLIGGCTKPGTGEEFIGKWVNTKKSSGVDLVIERNGDNFIVRHTYVNIMSGKTNTDDLPATLENGMLTIKAGLPISVTVDKSTGFLIADGKQYRRVD